MDDVVNVLAKPALHEIDVVCSPEINLPEQAETAIAEQHTQGIGNHVIDINDVIGIAREQANQPLHPFDCYVILSIMGVSVKIKK